MSEMGRKGGKIGGKRSQETMMPKERSARAKIGSLEEADGETPGAGAAGRGRQA
jgi:hypothetical protein